MRGMGEPHRQRGEDGLGVSGAPVALPIRIGPMEMGNRHSQHTSVMGLTKRPVQDCAETVPGRKGRRRTQGRAMCVSTSVPAQAVTQRRKESRDGSVAVSLKSFMAVHPALLRHGLCPNRFLGGGFR